jgi:malate dehydrogenase (oxaloacetate-decarboxylating)
VSAPRPTGSTDDDRLARAASPDAQAMRLHALCGGKIQTLPKCPIRGFEDFAVWYLGGVDAPPR